MPSEEDIVDTFRKALNGFKKPYLEALEDQKETPGKKDEEAVTEDDLQMNERIQDVLDKLDMLYIILEAAIRQGKNTRPDLDAQAVCSIFERNGVFPSLRENTALREQLLECLRVEIKLYPFTLNRDLMDSFIRKGVESHQREIVEN